jgi:hypothetical protein
VFVFNGESAFDLIAPGNKYVQCFDVRINKFCISGTLQSIPPELEGPLLLLLLVRRRRTGVEMGTLVLVTYQQHQI